VAALTDLQIKQRGERSARLKENARVRIATPQAGKNSIRDVTVLMANVLLTAFAAAIKSQPTTQMAHMYNTHDEIYSEREPPHSIQVEQALLGAILLSPNTLDRVSDLIDAGHFFDPIHGEIFDVALKITAAGRAPDALTVAIHFGDRTLDDQRTVKQYIGQLAANVPTIINARSYAKAIRDLSIRRGLILAGEDLVNAAYSGDGSTPDQIAMAEQALYRLAEKGSSNSEKSMAQIMPEVVARATAAQAAYKAGRLPGLGTGINDLDQKLGGLQASDLLILAGRPSMGKTALACNTAHYVAGVLGLPVEVFSLEMSAEQLGMRIAGEQAGIPSDRIRSGAFSDDELKAIDDKSREIAGLPLTIDGRGGVSIAQLAVRARRAKRKRKTALIIIDYLQLMTGTGKRDGNRVQDVTEVTAGLKALAKELDVPILALSQLSRNVEHRSDKRPQLADLRESGSIEQDADVVLFVFREEYYIEREKPPLTERKAYADWNEKLKACAGKAEIIIGKHRHGPIGIIPVQFDGQFTRFSNIAKSHQEEQTQEQPVQLGAIYSAAKGY
jgi:replicative DNA helicase